MAGDKHARIDPAASVISIARPDKRRGEFAHLEMEMRPVSSLGGPDRRDLFAPMGSFVFARLGSFRRDVVELHEFAHAIFFVGV
jgi:hypothetical protein